VSGNGWMTRVQFPVWNIFFITTTFRLGLGSTLLSNQGIQGSLYLKTLRGLCTTIWCSGC